MVKKKKTSKKTSFKHLILLFIVTEVLAIVVFFFLKTLDFSSTFQKDRIVDEQAIAVPTFIPEPTSAVHIETISYPTALITPNPFAKRFWNRLDYQDSQSPTEWYSDERRVLYKDEENGFQITIPEYYYSVEKEGEPNSVVRKVDHRNTYKFITPEEYGHTGVELNPKEKLFYIDTMNNSGQVGISRFHIFHGYKNEMELAKAKFLGTGMCNPAFQEPELSCHDDKPYCYTRQEIVNAIVKHDTVEYPDFFASSYGLNEEFRDKRDCRSYPDWVFRLPSGAFLVTDAQQRGGLMVEKLK